MGIMPTMGKRKLTKTALRAQGLELRELRGNRHHRDWCALLGDVPLRTYYRYEGGERPAPGPLMKLARSLGQKRKHGA